MCIFRAYVLMYFVSDSLHVIQLVLYREKEGKYNMMYAWCV